MFPFSVFVGGMENWIGRGVHGPRTNFPKPTECSNFHVTFPFSEFAFQNDLKNFPISKSKLLIT